MKVQVTFLVDIAGIPAGTTKGIDEKLARKQAALGKVQIDGEEPTTKEDKASTKSNKKKMK